MTDPSDIHSNISHVQGPHGERVIIVPANQEQIRNKEGNCTCCCIVLCSTFGSILLLLGTIYLGVTLSIPNNRGRGPDILHGLSLAGLILTILGGCFFLLIIPLARCKTEKNRRRIERFMHKDGGDERRLVLDYEAGFV